MEQVLSWMPGELHRKPKAGLWGKKKKFQVMFSHD